MRPGRICVARANISQQQQQSHAQSPTAQADQQPHAYAYQPGYEGDSQYDYDSSGQRTSSRGSQPESNGYGGNAYYHNSNQNQQFYNKDDDDDSEMW
jgi:hypothetical protein